MKILSVEAVTCGLKDEEMKEYETDEIMHIRRTNYIFCLFFVLFI